MMYLVDPRPVMPGVLLTLDPDAARLVADALESINPEDEEAEAFARLMAASIAGAVSREEHDAAYGDEHDENCPLCGVDAQTGGWYGT